MKVALTVLVVLLVGGLAAWFYWDGGSARLLVPLLAAGGLASVVQALMESKNVLSTPRRLDEGRFDLGFVADLLIGMVGAFASLIVGLAVLNERFFHDLPANVPQAPGDGAALQFAETVLLIPVWMRIASFGALTGFASRRLLPDLSTRIAGMVSGAVEQGVRNQARNQMENDRTQAEILRMLARTVQSQEPDPVVRAQRARVVQGEAEAAGDPVYGLLPLLSDFADANAADEASRNARKGEVADRFPAEAFRLHVTSVQIHARIRTLRDDDPSLEGWLAGLASLIALAPAPGDGARLLDVAGRARGSFVRGRFLTALYSLEVQRLLDAAEARAALAFLDVCIASGDPALQARARAIRALFARP